MPAEGAPLAPLPGFELAENTGNAGFQSRIFGADPGLVLWMTKNTGELPALFGFRHGTRGPYDAAVVPLLLANQDGVAQDRKNEGGLGGLDTDGHAVLTDVGNTLVVTDTTYTNVDISIDAGDSFLSAVVLVAPYTGAAKREWTYGGEGCPWPAAPEDKPPAPRLRRVGNQVTLTLGAAKKTCQGPEGRVSVWFRSPGGEVRLHSADIKRGL